MANFVRGHAKNYAVVTGFIAIGTLLQAALVRFGGADMPLAPYFPFIAAAAWATSLAGGSPRPPRARRSRGCCS